MKNLLGKTNKVFLLTCVSGIFISSHLMAATEPGVIETQDIVPPKSNVVSSTNGKTTTNSPTSGRRFGVVQDKGNSTKPTVRASNPVTHGSVNNRGYYSLGSGHILEANHQATGISNPQTIQLNSQYEQGFRERYQEIYGNNENEQTYSGSSNIGSSAIGGVGSPYSNYGSTLR